MRKSSHLIILIFGAALLAGSCRNDSTSPFGVADNPNLLGSWTHSYEEDDQGSQIEVYRPTGSRDFAPSWYRMRYVISEDGTCEWLVLDPADAHYMTEGRWSADPDDVTVIRVYDMDGNEIRRSSFRVIELTDDLLRLKRRPD